MKKNEFGDFQTNSGLAIKVCQLLKEKGINPKTLIEPTCGTGNFILSALKTFDNIENILGVEINKVYLEKLNNDLIGIPNRVKIKLENKNVFDYDFSKCPELSEPFLILGNPPWVTNSELQGKNLPKKSNSK